MHNSTNSQHLSTTAKFYTDRNSSEILTEAQARLLQPLWDLRLGWEDYLQSPVFPVVFSIAFFFGISLPFLLMDTMCKKHRWYRKYKIQPDKEVTSNNVYDTVSVTMWNQIIFIMPTAVAQWIWVPPTTLPELAPTLFEFFWHQFAGLVIFDFQYYIWHVTHHKVRFLYRHIHAFHHRYSSTFVMVSQYLHPWELVVVGLMPTTNMWFFNSHPLTVWSYMLLCITVSVEAHIGFDFPFLLHNLDPTGLFGGAPKHDMHHQKPMTNFQPFFNHLDKLFGTFCPPMRAGGRKTKDLLEYERATKSSNKIL